MSTNGYRQFNIADVAEQCNVSVQTIYYNFGSKKELLLASLDEYNRVLHELCYAKNKTPAVFLDIVDTYCACAKLAPHFLKEWLRCSYDPGSSMLLSLQEHGQSIKKRIIAGIALEFGLLPSCKPSSIAYLLSKTNTSSLYDWIIDNDYDRLVRNIAESTSDVISSTFVDGASHVSLWKEARGALVL